MKKPVKILLWLLGVPLGAALLVVFAFWLWQPNMFGEAVLDTEPPVLPDTITRNAVLVYSKTSGGFRHSEAIAAANAMIGRFAEKHGWDVFYTENAAIFEREYLEKFAVVVWNNATGAALSADQRLRFRTWLEGGGGYVGLHAAGDGSHANWEWYTEKVIKVPYNQHTLFPEHMPRATLYSENRMRHLAASGLPESWETEEEWYAFEYSPRTRGSTILVRVDESTYEPGKASMGEDHPMVWTHGAGLGRVFYSAFGHTAQAYSDPVLEPMMEKAVIWAGWYHRRKPIQLAPGTVELQ